MNPVPEQHLPNKYVLVFLITLGLFVLLFLFSDFLYAQRIAEIRQIENNINQSILESELQYALFADISCEEHESQSFFLLAELNHLATRLSYLEEQRGADDPEVIALKKHYSLLQLKDYLFLRERGRQCGERPPTVLYFYSNKGDCTDCTKMGFVLTAMRENYENLHIYSFDYHLGLSVIETLKQIYGLSGELPALVINRKPHYGFKSQEELEALLPGLVRISAKEEGDKKNEATTTR